MFRYGLNMINMIFKWITVCVCVYDRLCREARKKSRFGWVFQPIISNLYSTYCTVFLLQY
jgi:hypothetical protein